MRLGMRAFGALVGLGLAGQPVWAASDFLQQPAAACEWFAAQGLRAQLAWSKPQPDGPFWCQYATQFSSSLSTPVKAGRAVLDAATGKVALALTIQALGEVDQAGANAALQQFARDFLQAQGRVASPALDKLLAGGGETKLLEGQTTITLAEPGLWNTHKVVAVTFEAPASADLLQAAAKGPDPAQVASEAQLEKTLAARCDAAIDAAAFEGKPAAAVAAMQRKSRKASEGQYVFDYGDAAGNNYNCRVCDDLNPKLSCGGSLGALLQFNPKQGDSRRVPAELSRKCTSALQKALKPRDDGQFIDLDLVRRISVAEAHSDKSWIYLLQVAGREDRFRCVVRKRDLEYSLDRQGNDGGWSGIVGGSMY